MKRLKIILLCFMLTIILVACNQKSSDSEETNITEEQSDQGEKEDYFDEDKRLYISELQLTDDEKKIWELFTSDSNSSNIYSYTADDQIKSATLKCYQLNNDFSWLKLSDAALNVNAIDGLIVFSADDGILMINQNGTSMLKSKLGNSDENPLPLEGSISIRWEKEREITFDEEIPIGIMASVKDDRIVLDTCKLRDFYEPENLEEYDDVIVFTAYFSTSEKSEL